MNDWQMNLTKSIQKADPHGKITITSTTATTANNEQHGTMKGGMQMGMEQQQHEQHAPSSFSSPLTNNAVHVLIVKGATTLGNKAFAPNHIKIKIGSTAIWTNNDSNIHTVTSGIPNTPTAGQVFDSGLTSLITPSKTYSHKFTHEGEFSYFCRIHPTMVGQIEVVP
jgi:plastocyanin